MPEQLDFNPRSREGSDTGPCVVHHLLQLFQSTLPRRERRGNRRGAWIYQTISIHAPAKGATDTTGSLADTLTISIHAPAKGATASSGGIQRASTFQSTLPRRERHSRFPQWNSFTYFNPRSREGSDGLFVSLPDTFSQFQSTLPRRERLEREKNKVKDNEISIHAPAKGATSDRAPCRCPSRYFNPRSREGSDCEYDAAQHKTCHFNPRSREGSDPAGRGRKRRSRHFNPRSREGSDGAVATPGVWRAYFNPRSREGSDLQGYVHGADAACISIHAPAKGAT